MAPTVTRPPDEDEDQGYYNDADPDGLDDSTNGAAHKSEGSATPSPADLAVKEASGYGPYDKGHGNGTSGPLPHRKEKKALQDKTGGGFYRHEGAGGDHNTADSVKDLYDNSPNKKQGKLGGVLFGAKNKLDQKTANLSDGKKKLLFGAGLGGSGFALLLLAAVLLFATLKIPNLAEHIAGYQFARTARAFRQSLKQINSEKMAVDSMSEADQGKIKAHYEKFRGKTWGKLDKWRPGRTYKNMQATGTIDYKYSDPTFTGYQRLEAVRINGVEIPIDSPTWKQRVLNKVNPLTPKADIVLASQVEANIAKSLQGHNALVRSSIAKKIYADLGIKLHWWDKQGKTFKGTTAIEADLLELRESVKRMNAEIENGSLVKAINDATDAAEAAQKKCLENDDCAKRLLETHPDNPKVQEEIIKARATGDYTPTNFLADEAKTAIDSAIDNNAIKVAETVSIASTIIQGVCTIYDGSVDRSGSTVDGAGKSAMAAFMGIASAADQQKTGDTTAEAVGATNRKLDDISTSIPEQRAKNQNLPVSTDKGTSPQGSSAGMFSLLGAIFGQDTASKLDPVIEPACATLSSWQAGIVLGVAELALTIVTGGSSKLASGAGQAGANVGLNTIFAALRKSLLSKQALGRMLGESAAIAGLTIVAKMIVLSRMNVAQSGIARGTDYANNADAGGNLMANEQGRKNMGGRPLTQPEAAKSDLENRKYLSQVRSEKGAYERYLALSNPDSLLVNMGVGFSNQVTSKQGLSRLLAGSANRFSSSLINSSLVSSLNPFKSQVAYAQSQSIDTNYQIVQWGWSEDELALIENEATYYPLENDAVLSASGRTSEIESKYDPCFTESIGTLLATGKIQRDENGRIYENDGDCAPKKLGRSNPDGFGDLVFRWRISKRNDNTLDLLNDIANPTNSDSASASSANPGGGLGVSPDGFTFPLKTTKSHLTNRQREKWCYQKQTNCHHDYNAADIFADTGTPVVAAKGGKVIFAHNKPTGGTGSSAAIMGEDKNVYWYGHMKSGSVKITDGQEIKAGDEIGQVGEDADAQGTPSHLHIDVQGPPATTREGCTNQACAQPPFNFLDIQPALVKAFEALPG